MGFFSNLFRRKEEILRLAEGQEPIIDTDNNKMTIESNKSIEFRKGMKQEINQTQKSNDEEIENNEIVYDPKNFSLVLKWKEWYTKSELRNKYYDERGTNKADHISYGGALSVMQMSENQYKIMCTYVDKQQRKPTQFELGKIKAKSYYNTMHEMDSIISLQASGVFKGEMLKEEIKRHNDELKKIRDLQLSVLGEKILNSTGEEPIILPNISEENLYNRKIDFMSLPTKQTISQMPITCIQADATEQLQEEIDEKVEDFYRYCELALDIGAMDFDENLDNFYDLTQKVNVKRVPLYDRKPKLHRESYMEIQDKYLTNEQTDELKDKLVKRNSSTENRRDDR